MKKLIAYTLTSLLSISMIHSQHITPNIHKRLVQGYIKNYIPTYKHFTSKPLNIVILIASYYVNKFSKQISTKKEENIQKLLKQYQGDGEKILRTLSYNNRPKTLESFIKRYPDININSQSVKTGDTPLYLAANKKALAAFKVLIDHNALIHIENNQKESTWDIITNPNDFPIDALYRYVKLEGEDYSYRKPEGLYTTLPCRNLHAYPPISQTNNNFSHVTIKNILLIGPGIYLGHFHKSLYPPYFQAINGTSPSLAETMTFYPNAKFDIIDMFDISTAIEATKKQQENYHKVWQYCFKNSPQLIQHTNKMNLKSNKLFNKPKYDTCDFNKIKTNFIYGNLLDVRLKKNHYNLIHCLNVFRNKNTLIKQSNKWGNMFVKLINALKKQGKLLIDSCSLNFCMVSSLGVDSEKMKEDPNYYASLFQETVIKPNQCHIAISLVDYNTLEINFKNNMRHAFISENVTDQITTINHDITGFSERIDTPLIYIVTKR